MICWKSWVEKDINYANRLREIIKIRGKDDIAEISTGDCNELLQTINGYRWINNGWRGVIFLDPYAMNLRWSTLESIAKTKAFNVWYLSPLSALSRVLPKGGNIPESTKEKITYLLGTNEWEKEIYPESPQLSLFGKPDTERLPIEGIRKYVISRLNTIFPGVSEKALVLRNPQNNSPLFLLCFAVSNPSKPAINLSLKVANYILNHKNL
jgi:three-Cys-motif partner protein